MSQKQESKVFCAVCGLGIVDENNINFWTTPWSIYGRIAKPVCNKCGIERTDVTDTTGYIGVKT